MGLSWRMSQVGGGYGAGGFETPYGFGAGGSAFRQVVLGRSVGLGRVALKHVAGLQQVVWATLPVATPAGAFELRARSTSCPCRAANPCLLPAIWNDNVGGYDANGKWTRGYGR